MQRTALLSSLLSLLLLLLPLLNFPTAVVSETPTAAHARPQTQNKLDDDALKQAIDDAVANVAAKHPRDHKQQSESRQRRERREPRDYFRRYSQDDAEQYPKLSRRHILLFSTPEHMQENEEILLEAAEIILNPPPINDAEENAGGNLGGGKVLFLLVDSSDPHNEYIVRRCSVPKKTSKQGVLRLAQFPSKRPLEIYKPVGKYKVSAQFAEHFLKEVRSSGKGAARALMTEIKVKKFGNIDTKPTLLRAVGSTANFLVKRPIDVVLFSYLPTCAHCQEFNQTFLSVAQKCEEISCGVKFVLFDASKNEHSLVDPQSSTYPQVHMFKAHEKTNPIEFDNFISGAKALRYFIDSTRWFKDKPSLSNSEDDGFRLWDEEVDVMDAVHFNDFLSRVPAFVVMFFAHSSGQSKLVMPIYAKAGARLGFDKMPLIKIDCEQKGEHDEPVNQKLCGLFKLTHYPSVMYINTVGYKQGDDMTDYAELLDFTKYNENELLQWMQQKVSDYSIDSAKRIAQGKARSRGEL